MRNVGENAILDIDPPWIVLQRAAKEGRYYNRSKEEWTIPIRVILPKRHVFNKMTCRGGGEYAKNTHPVAFVNEVGFFVAHCY